MWFFSKPKTLAESGILSGMTDWHSHILPGVDDGIRTPEESLQVLQQYEEWGVKDLWLTPHTMEDYPNTTSDLKARFDALRKEWKGDIRLHLASEHMMDSLFEERLAANDVLPIGESGDHLLVETSYFNPPMNMDSIIEDIQKAGYYPLLAHPERYTYMDENEYHSLRERGVRFQLNYVSLVGGYGETARKKGEWLLKQGYADVIGSDVHRLASIRKNAEARPSAKWVIEKLSELAQRSI